MIRQIGLIAAFAALLAAFGVTGVLAQSAVSDPVDGAIASETVDYAAWDQVATRAEAALADGRASTAAFEDLRAALASWRTVFTDARDQNALRIRSLQSQIEALGQAPEDGAESVEIAARREALNEQLAALQAPRLQAEEAYNRADGLIGEIDDLIGTRQTEQLLRLGPSPLNPSIWAGATETAITSLRRLSEETASAWASDSQRQVMKNNAPAMLALLAAAAILLLRAPGWAERVGRRLAHLAGRPGIAELSAIGMALVDYLVRVFGFLALVQIVRLTGMAGFRGQIVVDVALLAGIAYLSARALVRYLVPTDDGPGVRARAVRLAGLLSLVWSLHLLITRSSAFDFYSDETIAVLTFPVLIIGSVLLFRLAGLLRFDRPATVEDEPPPATQPMRLIAIRWGRTFLYAVSIIAPLAAAIGYLDAAIAVYFPTLMSLVLLAALVLLSVIVRAFYALATGKDAEGVSHSLPPVLANLFIAILALPVLAVIWGVRTAQIEELWTRFLAGFQFGETRISPSDFIVFAAVFVAGFVVTRAIQTTMRNSVLPKTRIDSGGQAAIVSGIGYVGIFLAAIIAISAAGIDLSSLAIVAGALSVGIGFGLQNIVSNFVSGIILLIERPIGNGDWIEVGGIHGTVREISVRSTRIETFDRSDVILPNSDLVSGTVTNYTRSNLVGRITVAVSVAYGTDTRMVESLLREIAEAHPVVLRRPPPSVLFRSFGADGLDFEIRAFLRDINEILNVKSDLNHEIARRFGEAGIEIPFAQRDIWLRNPEVLRPDGVGDA